VRTLGCVLLLALVGCDGDPPIAPDAGSDAGAFDAGRVRRDAGLRDAGQSAFSVLTLRLPNAARDGASWDAQRARITETVAARRPDVICLQDVVESDTIPNFAETLADEILYAIYFEPTYDAGTHVEGIALLTLHINGYTSATALPFSDVGFGDRLALFMAIETFRGVLNAFCTQLSTTTDETMKADEAAALMLWMDDRRLGRRGFLAGAMHAEPDSLAQGAHGRGEPPDDDGRPGRRLGDRATRRRRPHRARRGSSAARRLRLRAPGSGRPGVRGHRV